MKIQDVPEKKNENLIVVIVNIGNFLNFRIEKSVIDYITLVPTVSADKDKPKPKNIIIRFLSKLSRDEFLARTKAKRIETKLSGFKIDGISDRLFINDYLTPMNNILYKNASVAAKQHQFKYVWVRSGNIFVRKDDTTKIL
ncbi:hypothetical protein HHI36_023466 [Cryptolaemus montrouzieri]|uniref:FP protein C-terminal domain-containing protein n=1 Tax=Cryptolaemus montrouzieri TaxID=559131 RepID=A0ABD2PGH9_9CUCU